eukprot:TRINITY_DN7206_c0_g1_i1.p1 TRINITY_DN7206_c0_g1~~TRINITY_DN7206_c0_g1_i1.p1  ORF type:complete len:1082 (+),score=179.87 TRINITY_DN7206_c0_g1_i1:156-3401(+)
MEEDASRNLYASRTAYKHTLALTVLKWTLVVLTGGCFGLLLFWSKEVRRWFRTPTTEANAELFVVESLSGTTTEVPVETDPLTNLRFFSFQCTRFFFDGATFRSRDVTCHTWTYASILAGQGLGSDVYLDPHVRLAEGKNLIDVPMTPFWEDCATELLGPVYVYQYACCLLWFLHDYAPFASILLTCIFISAIVGVYTSRVNRNRIRELAAYTIEVSVLRDNHWVNISSEDLLPGDLLLVPPGGNFVAPCDWVQVSGCVIVDESSLTGESLPVVKLPPTYQAPHMRYDPDKNKKSTVFSGTKIIGVNPSHPGESVIGMVARTGFSTLKGSLVRTILSSEPVKYSYVREAEFFLAGLFVVGLILFLIALWLWGAFSDVTMFGDADLWFYGLESIAILVPPSLPLVFHVGLLFSAKNLEKNTVYTLDPTRIPIAGKVDTFCFDKTGTLTQPGLDVIGVVESRGEKFTEITPVAEIQSKALVGLVTCHSLSRLGNIIDFDTNTSHPEYSGPMIDMKMFEATGWKYFDADKASHRPYPYCTKDGTEYEILKRFDFDHNLQRMSVIVRDSQTHATFVFTKGSLEAVSSCCDPSGVPRSASGEAKRHAVNGCYVLALASKPFNVNEEDIKSLKREDVENGLRVLGLILARNELKHDTAQAICDLHTGGVNTKIITGDTGFTAFYIAVQCGIIERGRSCYMAEIEEGILVWRNIYVPEETIDPNFDDISNAALGVTSSSFDYLVRRKEVDTLVNKVTIFSRMKPLEKEAIVVMHQEAGLITGMCGDGANDCAALRTAHCGIALSDAEASLVSPFSAKSMSTVSTVDTIKEGRSCLANSFCGFKFTLLYGILQTSQMLISYAYRTDLSEGMYLYEDFGIYVPLAFAVIRSYSEDTISTHPPTARVFGFTTLLSLFGAISIAFITMWVTLVLLTNESWYFPQAQLQGIGNHEEIVRPLPEVTSVFLVGCMNILGGALAFTLGGPWRKAFYLNIPFMVVYGILIVFTVYMVLSTSHQSFLAERFFLDVLPTSWQLKMFTIGIVGALLMSGWERLVLASTSYTRSLRMKEAKIENLENSPLILSSTRVYGTA